MISKKTIYKCLYNAFLVVVLMTIMLPIYYLLVTTFKTPAEATVSPLGLPKNFTLENYVKALKAMNYFHTLRNNLVIAIGSVSFLVIFSSMAAYVIARGRTKLFRGMYAIFLGGLIIPFQISIIPLYRIISGLGLMNTHLGVIIVNVFCINLPLCKGIIDMLQKI